MIYFVYIFFGLIPSILWLIFYLRKDAHPEPNRMIIKIFLYGILIAIVALTVEVEAELFGSLLVDYNHFLYSFFSYFPSLKHILYWIIGVAFVEEFLKYLVVKKKVLSNPEFDEPTDAIIYMIVAALGFAALENISFIAFPAKGVFNAIQMINTISFRFITATFLHALCSGLIGFFIALSILKTERRWQLTYAGLAIASILHGAYDFSIMKLSKNNNENFYYFYFIVIILILLTVSVSFGFKKVKEMSSVCEIDDN